jgi:transmembrane sensor
MRGPNADAQRVAFEAWLARSASHRSAYSRISEVFSMGKRLKPLAPIDDQSPPTQRPSRPYRHFVLVVGGVALLSSIAWLATDRSGLLQGAQYAFVARKAAAQSALPSRLTTRLGEIRQFRLSDGSTVTLDTDSQLLLAYGPDVRRLRLERGRARFTVAHEERPFIVAAGRGWVTAHGTIFDVRLTSKAIVVVRLLRGAIDVDLPRASRSGDAQRVVKRIRPGGEIAFTNAQVPAPPTNVVASDDNWPAAIRDLDHVRLADLVAEANRYSMIRISLASPVIGDLRVSGTFRINDPSKLADNLAALLGLDVDARTPGEIRLDRLCTSDEYKNCRPIS